MKTNININNYEEFALDYLEKQLSPDQLEAFELFLNAHPIIAEELFALNIIAIPQVEINFDKKKELLKKDKKSNRIIYFLAMAASFAALMTISYFYLRGDNYNNTPAYAQVEIIEEKTSATNNVIANIDKVPVENNASLNTKSTNQVNKSSLEESKSSQKNNETLVSTANTQKTNKINTINNRITNEKTIENSAEKRTIQDVAVVIDEKQNTSTFTETMEDKSNDQVLIAAVETVENMNYTADQTVPSSMKTQVLIEDISLLESKAIASLDIQNSIQNMDDKLTTIRPIRIKKNNESAFAKITKSIKIKFNVPDPSIVFSSREIKDAMVPEGIRLR